MDINANVCKSNQIHTAVILLLKGPEPTCVQGQCPSSRLFALLLCWGTPVIMGVRHEGHGKPRNKDRHEFNGSLVETPPEDNTD